jgi:hypothetical protein
MNNQQAKNFFAFIGAFVVALAMFGAGAMLAGCNREDPIVQKSRFVSLGGPAQIPYQEAVIEGCQYLFYDRGITHKGNCTNSIHIYNRQLEENK